MDSLPPRWHSFAQQLFEYMLDMLLAGLPKKTDCWVRADLGVIGERGVTTAGGVGTTLGVYKLWKDAYSSKLGVCWPSMVCVTLLVSMKGQMAMRVPAPRQFGQLSLGA